MKKPLSIKELLDKNNVVERLMTGSNNISVEFQDFGYRLAVKLEDLPHTALYIKLAKDLPRGILEEAMEFSLDYPITTGKRAKIFMWKLYRVCEEKGVKMPRRSFKKKEKPQLKLI